MIFALPWVLGNTDSKIAARLIRHLSYSTWIKVIQTVLPHKVSFAWLTFVLQCLLLTAAERSSLFQNLDNFTYYRGWFFVHKKYAANNKIT